MTRQLRVVTSLLVLTGIAARVDAGPVPFSLLVVDDGHVCNDSQYGPDAVYNTSAIHIRNIDAPRRRVGFLKFDVSSIKGPGRVASNVSISLYGYGAGNVDVYGVIESLDHTVADFQTLTWNTAPGVKNNPAPPASAPVELDMADLVGPLLSFQTPAADVRASSPTSQALADFVNADTDGIVVLLLSCPAGQSAMIRELDWNAGQGGAKLEGMIGGLPVLARDPYPADQESDVERTVVLGWTPGTLAAGHNVYLGMSQADVNAAEVNTPLGVLAAEGQDANTFEPPVRLEFGQTYSWRVDEVNAPPDTTVFRGSVWSFTVEPFVYQMRNITATASSSAPGVGPENTVNGSGLDAQGLHSTAETAMWVSSKTAPQPAWIQYQFDRVYQLQEMRVWNYNHSFESTLGFGFKDVTIEYSPNGTDWTTLGDVQFAQGPAADGYAHLPPVDLQGVPAQYVRLTAKSNFGGMTQFGLSEVQFFYTPAHARRPAPATAAVDVSVDPVLSWRAGREAAAHTVYFGTDQQAVLSGTVAASASSTNSYQPAPLMLATKYYWKVNEVNEAETPSVWEGSLWDFATVGYLVVDDFERYNDEEDQGLRIYETWIDGWADSSSGSTVGYVDPPFAERTTVHAGSQSMPLAYDNSTLAFSEATRTFDPPQDWTAHGVKAISLFFNGSADNMVGTLYLKINGKKVVYSGLADDLKTVQWLPWKVGLSQFGADLKKVKTLSIGIDGAGAVGKLCIDDIQLVP